jgi:chemotaxis protein MotB
MKEVAEEGKTQSRVSRPFPGKALIEKSRPAIDIDSNWLITLSDVLSLLLIFFVMFSVLSKTGGKPVAEENHNHVAANTHMEDLSARDEMVGEMSSAIKKHNLGNDVSVMAVNKEIIVTLKERVTFRPGEAETLKSSEPMLDTIAQIIKRYPAFLVDIEGHTDNVPIKTRLYPSNWELSVARSTNVLKYFINHNGIDPSRLSIKGYADQKPLAVNDTSENRAQNRRVEIRLKEKES